MRLIIINGNRYHYSRSKASHEMCKNDVNLRKKSLEFFYRVLILRANRCCFLTTFFFPLFLLFCKYFFRKFYKVFLQIGNWMSMLQYNVLGTRVNLILSFYFLFFFEKYALYNFKSRLIFSNKNHNDKFPARAYSKICLADHIIYEILSIFQLKNTIKV